MPTQGELVNEVRRLRALLLEHAQELAALRDEARRMRERRAAGAQLSAEEIAFARDMGAGICQTLRARR